MQMKSLYLTLVSAPGAFAISTVLLFAAPLGLSAKDHKNGYSLGDVPQILNNIVNGAGNSTPVTAVRSIPGYVVALGNGYQGRGYYYGPANTQYYEKRQGVRYYSTYEEVPREYYSNGQGSNGHYREANSVGASVQQALARNGYYNGPVDGQIGPKSRRSIAAYQQDHGLAVTGNINSALMASLGL